MPDHDSASADLTSWKDIANRLGISVRTAQMWERDRGLPVRRVPGSRSRVSLRISDLEHWLAIGGEPQATDSSPTRHERNQTVQFGFKVWQILLALAILGTGIAVVRTTHRSLPVGLRFEAGLLTAVDSSGAVTWTKFFPDIEIPAYARRLKRSLPPVQIANTLDERSPNILIALYHPHGSGKGYPLACISSRGEELWRFNPQIDVSTATRDFSSRWMPEYFTTSPLAKGGEPVILLTSHHPHYWPGALTILSVSGKPLSRYLHSGAITALNVIDLDGDGRKELILGAVNNANQTAELVVLDSEKVSGASRESNQEFQILGHPAARERARLLFPRSCIVEELGPYSRVEAILPSESGFEVHVQQNPDIDAMALINYRFDRKLTLVETVFSVDYQMQHRQLADAHRLDHKFSENEAAALRKLVAIGR